MGCISAPPRPGDFFPLKNGLGEFKLIRVDTSLLLVDVAAISVLPLSDSFESLEFLEFFESVQFSGFFSPS